MSDIDLQFTWWQIVLWILAPWFWPLTFGAVGAAIWVWRQRRSKVGWAVAIVVVGLWTISGATNLSILATRARNHAQYIADLRARQSTLAHGSVVAGVRVPAGTVVTRAAGWSGEVAAFDLPIATVIHGVPLRGHVGLSSGALDGEVRLARDARIGGIPCTARAPVRFEAGKLLECRLAESSRIRGVPCAGDINLESGLVCTLAADYARFGFTWRAQTKLTDYGDLVWFGIGPVPPSLQVLGSALPRDSEVQFAQGHVAGVDVRSHPLSFHGCAIQLIYVQGLAVTGQPVGACNIPEAHPGPYVALPARTFGGHLTRS
jgi:hypothetical protein